MRSNVSIRATWMTISFSGVLCAAVLLSGGVANASSPVAATGSINCGLDGSVKFAPPLINGGTLAAVGKFKGSLSNCTGTHNPSGITGGKVTGSFALSTNDCNAHNTSPGLEANFGPASFVVKWKGSTKLQPSMGSSTIGAPSALNWQEFDIPGFSFVNLTGSFGSDLNTSLHASFGRFSFAQFAADCQPKTRGLPGSGGVKKVLFSAQNGSNLSISS